MPPGQWAAGELQGQRDKLTNSYQELLSEFGAKDLANVGNYSVGRLIGKGSFGKVYLASHKLTNGSKVVLKSAKKDDQNLAREIHHHRQFVHPHIARLYEVIVTESLVWLVLEYCPGDELYNHLLQNGKMPEAEVQRVFTQLVGAVAYVHMKGCVHRDLKLENILLDKHGSVKLVDFGFTREYQGTTSYLQTWCGTVAYSAPEMIKGEKYAGEKVDVWSLGIILYALLVGELPFDDDDDTITKQKILKEDPPFPDDFPEGVKELVQKLLSKRPLLRPTIPDILRHPWLGDFAPQQQEILKLQQPAPFSTQLEKETLDRMRSAGVDIDMVIEHVLAQRCDSLAGWWALLMEKEERKAKRRERRRAQKEKEEKALRRLSAASGRLLIAPSLREINEEEQTTELVGNPPRVRGRKASRSNASSTYPPDLPRVEEQRTPTPEPARPFNKDPTRSTSSTRRRPIPPPKEPSPKVQPQRSRTVSRSSSGVVKVPRADPEGVHEVIKRKKMYHLTFRDQLANIRTWFRHTTRRTIAPTLAKNHQINHDAGHTGLSIAPSQMRRSSTAQVMELRKAEQKLARPELPSRVTLPARPRLSTASSFGSNTSGSGPVGMTRAQVKRLSLSPTPLTPRSNSYRRRSGLGGRKSTSSSVSSVRSIHLASHPSGISHSKASSTSSASVSLVASPNLSNSNNAGSRTGRSPHASVKILQASPTATVTLPPSIRVQRRGAPSGLGPLPTFADVQTQGGGSIGPSSPGMHAVFARQKRKIFRGPTGFGGNGGGGGAGRNVTPTAVLSTASSSSLLPSAALTDRNGKGRKRQSIEVIGTSSAAAIAEEDEDEEDQYLTPSYRGHTPAAAAPHMAGIDIVSLSQRLLATPDDGVRLDEDDEDGDTNDHDDMIDDDDLEIEEVEAFGPVNEEEGEEVEELLDDEAVSGPASADKGSLDGVRGDSGVAATTTTTNNALATSTPAGVGADDDCDARRPSSGGYFRVMHIAELDRGVPVASSPPATTATGKNIDRAFGMGKGGDEAVAAKQGGGGAKVPAQGKGY